LLPFLRFDRPGKQQRDKKGKKIKDAAWENDGERIYELAKRKKTGDAGKESGASSDDGRGAILN